MDTKFDKCRGGKVLEQETHTGGTLAPQHMAKLQRRNRVQSMIDEERNQTSYTILPIQQEQMYPMGSRVEVEMLLPFQAAHLKENL